tara:strand:- start:518 stop:1468 length:951 start_codon:yes stop_codon:yes gene_type:complete
MLEYRRAFICGLKSTKITNSERKFLKKFKPWGIILFSRNIKTIKQTKNLTNNIKKIFNDKNYPILIDEEGGRVSRLKNFIDSSIFTANYFGNLFKNDKKKFNLYLDIYIKQISYLLISLGININSVPVLDIRRLNSSKIIGDRSYSSNPSDVYRIGKIVINKFNKSRISTIIKHIPGHGLAKVDSHNKRPLVSKNLNYLNKIDFVPYKNQNSLFAMTAHIVFSKIDPKFTVTHSSKIIKIIRNKIGFKNIIITDDISMKSLKYSIKENTIKAFTAGCNIVLHCNGNLKEMKQVAENSPKINDFIAKKTSQFRKIIS